MQVVINGYLQPSTEGLQPDTKFFEQEQDARARQRMPTGAAMPDDTQPIRLAVGNQTIVLPPGEVVIVGRGRAGANTPQADVDLSMFNAEDNGVSRLHVKFIRRGQLVLISDLNSTNGTYLNGHRLIAGSERLIRDADHLRIGLLNIIVQFGHS